MKKTIILGIALAVGSVMVASAADVNENWDKNCTKCHGAEGKGDTKMGQKLGIKDLSDAKLQAELKDDAMIKAIKEGVKDGDTVKMKGFADTLSDDEIKALVQKARSFKK